MAGVFCVKIMSKFSELGYKSRGAFANTKKYFAKRHKEFILSAYTMKGKFERSGIT